MTDSKQPAIQEQEINLHQFLLVVRRRYPYLIAIFFVCVLLAGVYSFRQIPLYHGTALLIFEPGNNTAPVDFANFDQIKLNDFIETQKKIITSRRVVGRTLEALNIQELSPKDTGGLVATVREALRNARNFLSTEQENPVEPDPIELFTKQITAEPLHNTNLMQLQVADPDPEKAARYTNTLARIYIEYDLEDRRNASGNAFTWLSEQVAILKAKVQTSEMDLLKYK
ncbi:MAG: hypothetical protein D3906_13550, partial [Candidatus Electrothrix sp. AUS1_2]|nr:hypothetical protein [Candidatus Electrothrix sp. AUS1_2]